MLKRLAGQVYDVQAFADLNSMAESLGDDTGIVLITEEALGQDTGCLSAALSNQAPWSEIPILLLASNRTRAGKDNDFVRSRLPLSAKNVVVLERPMSSAALMSAIGAAWQSRVRQFEMRDRLAELALERERLRILLESVPVGISFVDVEGVSLISNPLYAQYVPDRVIPSRSGDQQKNWISINAEGERVGPNMFAGARALRGEVVDGMVFCHRPAEGTESWIRMSAVPLWNSEGAIIGAAIVIVDINDQKQAEFSLRKFNESLEEQVATRTQALAMAVDELREESRERERAEEQLRQSLKMEAVGQLTGGIAHDFNNMLTGILGSLDLMSMKLEKGKTTGLERYIDAAQTSARRAASLTERLLAFSRRQSLDTKPFSANDLIISLYDLLKRSVTEQVSVVLDLNPDNPWALADSNQLENAILNLVINARDAMPHGGTVTITTSKTVISDQPSAHDGLKLGQYVQLDVCDTGTGINRDQLSKVVEPFYTTKPIGQGTGLGLSMVYGFAKQSHGQMVISSEVDVGTTVSLYLPAVDAQRDDGDAIDHVASPGIGQKILLVEDDPSVRNLNQEVLLELGYDVFTAVDGQEALRVLSTMDRIDLLVTDVGLPGMNGRQLAEIVQQQHPNLPILFLTGYAQAASEREHFLGHNMSLITKPFTLQALADNVSRMLDQGPQLPH